MNIASEDNKAKVTLHIPDKSALTFSILTGTLGPKVIDVSKLNKENYFTFDPGFQSTAACTSAITFIDGDQGILLHRGYPIEQLAEDSDYLEVCYLLFYGELPDKKQKETFLSKIHQHTMVHEQLALFLNGFPRTSHPMSIMCGVVGALSAFYHDHLEIKNPHHRELAAYRLIAKMPTIAAMAYKYSIGQPFIYPQNHLSHTENFLNMMFAVPANPNYQVNPILSKAMDKIFILHADHEQNASTSTVRLAGSSGANPFACISAAIVALWGPAHGGANEAVLNMLQEIGNVSRIGQYIKKAKDKQDPFRLMGFGHRVYKNFDPRAKVMRQTCYEVLEALQIHDNPLFQLALKLEEIALQDEYFIQKKLYPNVDFYSGIILKAIGIPINMFTVIFAIARTVGWISQWNEMMSNQDQKIGRPRQLYIGLPKRDFIPVNQRQ